MKNSIFDYRDYKKFLKDTLDSRAESERGVRSRLAEAAKCHTAYVSQVLNGRAHFSLEQAELIARFCGLGKDETAFLFLLVQYNRAGTDTLQAHFQEQLNALADKQLVLKNRLEFQKTLSREDQATFYSSWHYGAVHVLVSVPGCNNEPGIASYLGLPISKVVEVLQFLQRVGMIIKKEGRYSAGISHTHLEHDSPMISKHHINWRMKVIESLDEAAPQDLHYSSVISCSREDAPKIKAALIRAIDEVRAIVKPSKDEGAFAYCLDFFGLKRER